MFSTRSAANFQKRRFDWLVIYGVSALGLLLLLFLRECERRTADDVKDLDSNPPPELTVALTLEAGALFHNANIVVLPDGTVFATGISSVTRDSFVAKMHLSDEERQRLARLIQNNDFFTLPEKLHADVLDGSTTYLSVAWETNFRRVNNYASDHPRFVAISGGLIEIVNRKMDAAMMIGLEELARTTSEIMAATPGDDPLRRVLTQWIMFIPTSTDKGEFGVMERDRRQFWHDNKAPNRDEWEPYDEDELFEDSGLIGDASQPSPPVIVDTSDLPEIKYED